MSWLARLYETYENIEELDLSSKEHLLWPVSHLVKNAHLEVFIDNNGSFFVGRTKVIHGMDAPTLIPVTESSAGRTGSKNAPHPLSDELGYCAADLPNVNKKKNIAFMEQLREWVKSPFSHPKVEAILRYLDKGSLWHDLASEIEFPVKIEKVKGSDKIKPEKVFIRWRVEQLGEPQSSTWEDRSLIKSWINFDRLKNGKDGFCYVTGAKSRRASNHPRFLRKPGDGAKLISSNDHNGFTFRGRFTDSQKSIRGKGAQAACISFEVTQKAHHALRWLIARQGYFVFNKYKNDKKSVNNPVLVTWAVSGKETPEPLQGSWELFTAEILQVQEEEIQDTQIDHGVDLGSSFAHKFNRYLAGYHSRLESNEQIVIMGLDSATTGRMGIIYYRELLASEFLGRLTRWHQEFAWPQRHTIEIPSSEKETKNKKKTIWPVGCPSPKTIADAAYGDVLKSNETLKKSILERILPCIVDGRPFPEDILQSAVRRACKRHSQKHWEWERNLSVTCALYKGYHMRHPDKSKQKEYAMPLEEERTSRNYLYGRLLAIAEYMEEIALNVGGENRPTSAARMMQRFADHPFSTWRTIEIGLQPYMQRLQSKRTGFLKNRQKELDHVLSLFDLKDFTSEQPLDGEFLLGYHCQKQNWRKNKTEDSSDNNKGE